MRRHRFVSCLPWFFAVLIMLPAPARARRPGWNQGRTAPGAPSRRQRQRFKRQHIPLPLIVNEDLQGASRVLNDVVHTSAQLQRDVQDLARRGVKVSTIAVKGSYQRGFPQYRLDLPATATPRRGRRPLRVLISARIHGDEPAGSKAAVDFLRWASRNKDFRQQFDVTVLPMINPTNRHNVAGENQNRCFRDGCWTPLTEALRDNLTRDVQQRGRFDLFLDLHADYVGGTFLVAAGRHGKLDQRIVSALPKALLARPRAGRVVGRPYRFHGPGTAFTDTAGTFKQFMKDQLGTPVSYTVEYDRTLANKGLQTRSLMKLMRSALYNTNRHGRSIGR